MFALICKATLFLQWPFNFKSIKGVCVCVCVCTCTHASICLCVSVYVKLSVFSFPYIV